MNTQMKIRTFSLIASLSFVALATSAQEAPTPPAAANPQLGGMPGITLDMIRTGFEQRFDRMDANGDGVITKEEVAGPQAGAQGEARPRRGAGEPQAERRPRADRQGAGNRRPPRAGGGGLPMPRLNLEDIDANGDGQVSRAEWAAQYDELATFDTNGDGRLDMQEVRAMRQSAASASKPAKRKE